MTADLKNEIYLVITDYTIAEYKGSKFSNYVNFCEYVHNCMKSNKLYLIGEHIDSIVKGCNEVFGFGNAMYHIVFDFFNYRKYNKHYELVQLIISEYGYYIK